MPPPASSTTGLAITNPLVLYRALVATHRLQPDESQHRLAIHLQKLYHRLKDYEPTQNYRQQLSEVGLTLDRPEDADQEQTSRLFARAGSDGGFLARFRAEKVEADRLALTRRFTSHESALHIDSPQGLLLHGEVGTGKSMLVDLLADALPTRKKRRYHFNTFMLEMLARLETLRRERKLGRPDPALALEDAQSSALLLLARDLVASAPILFLDEFQLPDRAAAKILSHLFTAFFHLGGVLVATSNRMPEELANAAGIEFGPAAARSPFSKVQQALFGRPGRGRSEGMFSRQSDFVAFLEVLKARCETWDMNSARDWRRVEMEGTAAEAAPDELDVQISDDVLAGLEDVVPGNLGLGFEQSKSTATSIPSEQAEPRQTPSHYHISPSTSADSTQDSKWDAEVRQALSTEASYPDPNSPIPWNPATVRVYGRTVPIPRTLGRVCLWTFSELCASNLGPADYITLASTYHTLILTDVPVLSLLQKNEARRFITLLDALYEARCKLLVRAEAGPDGLFFPESSAAEVDNADSTYAETFSEIFQDQTAPFRPNVSSYTSADPTPSSYTPTPNSSSSYTPSASAPSYATSPLPQSFSAARSILADEDSDFGPVYGASRSSSSPSSVHSSHHRPRGPGDGAPGAGHEIGPTSPDFQRTATFTGEDERFAYKRARSRLWEMCGARWWGRREEGWWRPLAPEVRHWERPLGPGVRHWERGVDEPVPDRMPLPETERAVEVEEKRASEAPGGMFPHGASPFRTRTDPPPKIAWTHAWGMMSWGKKAGVWGKGPEGLGERKGQQTGGDGDEVGGKREDR